MKRHDVDIIARETVFQGYYRIDRHRLRHRLFEGGWSGEMSREVFERGHAVALVPYDPDLDRLVFIEQFRIGALAAMDSPWFDDEFSPWLLEFVAGIIEDGESPEEVARREAVEEAGCEVGEMVLAHHYLVSPGASSKSIFVYCGRVDAARVGGIHGLDHEHEDIRVVAVPPDEAFAWLDGGRIGNATTIVALQWFRHNRQRLRALWIDATP